MERLAWGLYCCKNATDGRKAPESIDGEGRIYYSFFDGIFISGFTLSIAEKKRINCAI